MTAALPTLESAFDLLSLATEKIRQNPDWKKLAASFEPFPGFASIPEDHAKYNDVEDPTDD